MEQAKGGTPGTSRPHRPDISTHGDSANYLMWDTEMLVLLVLLAMRVA